MLLHVVYVTLFLASFSGKGPSQPAPKFVGNCLAFLLNLVIEDLKCYINGQKSNYK